MNSKLTLVILAVVAGCTKTATEDFVQGNLRITPPREKVFLTALEDGGSIEGKIKDAKGRRFDVFIDYRLGTKTPGAVYFNGDPGEPKSVLVTNGAVIKQLLAVR